MPRSRYREVSRIAPVALAAFLAFPARPPSGQEQPLRAPDEPVRVRVELIQVFVTVVDRAGNPVTDLQASDFVLLENGDPMEVAVFEPPDRQAAEPVPAPAKPDEEPAVAPPQAEPAPARPEGRTYVVLFDGYNNPSGLRFKKAKDATLRFVDERFQEGDRMAVFELRPQMRALCDLSTGVEEIQAAVRKAAFLPGSGNEGLLSLIDATITDTATRSGQRAQGRLQNLARFNEMLQQSGQREFYDNLTAIGNAMTTLPGRKYLVLFSGGFPFLQPTEQIYGYADPLPAPFRSMVNEMARSNTAIYTLNIGDESFGADVERSGNLRLSLARVGMDENTLEYLGLGSIAFGDDPFYTKQTLAILAGETGGRFINDADYDKALASIDRELDGAYTLAYYPTNLREDGRFRRIKVKVKGRSALQVQHRTGYFAPKPYRSMDPEERQAQLAEAALGRFHREDLPVSIRVGFLPGEAGQTMATVALEVPVRTLEHRPQGEETSYVLDLVLLARDATGEVVDSVSKVVTAKLGALPPPDGGLRMIESLTLPPGDGEMHLVVRDNERGSTTTRTEQLQVPDYRYRTLTLTSLHLMTEGSGYQLVDADFLSAPARKRMAREARDRSDDAPLPRAPSAENPFLLPDGSMFQPSPRRRFAPGEDLLVYLQVLNLGWSDELGSPLLSVTFDLKDAASGSLRLPSRQEALLVQGAQGRPCTVVYRLGLEGLDPGEYALRVTVLDKVANTAVQGSEPIRIEGSPPDTARADGTGR